MSEELEPEQGFDAWYAEQQAKASPEWFERKSTIILLCGLLLVIGCIVLGRSQPSGSDSGSAGVSADASSSKSISDIESESVDMSFDDCIDHIQTMAGKLGVTPVNIVETSSMRMVRFPTSDGSVLITCSTLDDTMVVTKSPYS